MNDSLNKLRGLAAEIKAQGENLRAQFEELERHLHDSGADYDITGRSENCLLESYGDDDAYYGYLYFEGKLAVAYRTREDDTELALRDEPEEITYSLQTLEKCSLVWLRALAAPQIIESLLVNTNARLQETLSATKSAVQTISAAANLPLRDLEAGLTEAATQLKFGDVVQQWHEAQSALGIYPPDATTRASRLVETLCKHILHAKDKTLPGDQSIQSLYRAASRALVFGPEQQSSADLRAIGSALMTLTASIGALRTHTGTAHGTGPNSRLVTFSQARLSVNASGVLATFLMDMLLAGGGAPTSETVS